MARLSLLMILSSVETQANSKSDSIQRLLIMQSYAMLIGRFGIYL